MSAEQDRLRQLAPVFRPVAALVLGQVRTMLAVHSGDAYEAVVMTAWRSHLQQKKAFDAGASKALPGRSPHNVMTAAGVPASLAIDIAITEPDSRPGAKFPRKYVGGTHPVWGLIPAAAWVICQQDEVLPDYWLRSGSSFRNIPGGDWPHVEIRNWRKFAPQGVLRAEDN
tara:strand:- start:144 stop:653 length:510 start_codon:yes stop_codon:yes gene_type:complete